jgi:hypothetical protein
MFTIQLELTASQSFLEAIRTLALAMVAGQGVTLQPETEKPVKVATPTAPAAQPAVEKEVAAETTTTTEEVSTYTLEKVRAAAQAKSQSGKRAEVKALLTEFGADSLPLLEAAKYNDFMLRLETL